MPQVKKRSREELCHLAWKKMRCPFILPHWATHVHEWEVYDANMAGCKKCGTQHVCKAHTCATIQFEDSSSVCPITGLCIPCIFTSNDEFLDCNTIPTYNDTLTAPKTSAERDESLSETITQTLQLLLTSHTAEQLLKNEREKLTKRRTVAFNKRARQAKTTGDANMIDIISHTVHQTSNYRTLQIIPLQSRERLCQTCTMNILRVFKLLNLHGEGRGWKRGTHRTKGLIIGLIYMTRMGVMWNDTVILPCIPIMRDILPQESCLTSLFDMRPKIITETENFVKMSIRNTPSHTIVKFAENQHGKL